MIKCQEQRSVGNHGDDARSASNGQRRLDGNPCATPEPSSMRQARILYEKAQRMEHSDTKDMGPCES